MLILVTIIFPQMSLKAMQGVIRHEISQFNFSVEYYTMPRIGKLFFCFVLFLLFHLNSVMKKKKDVSKICKSLKHWYKLYKHYQFLCKQGLDGLKK